MNWQFRALVAHGLRTARADAGRSATIALFAAALCGSVFYGDLSAARDIRQERASRIAGGLHVLQVSAESGLDARHCERLSSRAGVVASGGMTAGPLVVLEADGLTQIPTGRVTPGFLEVSSVSAILPSKGSDGGFIVGQALADQLRLSVGAVIDVEGQPPAPLDAVLVETDRHDSLPAGCCRSHHPSESSTNVGSKPRPVRTRLSRRSHGRSLATSLILMCAP